MSEKTGTIVMGENVRISTVAVAHGSLSVEIREEKRFPSLCPSPHPSTGSSPVAAVRARTPISSWVRADRRW